MATSLIILALVGASTAASVPLYPRRTTYGSGELPECPEGFVRRSDGFCVEPIINKRFYLYNAPQYERPHSQVRIVDSPNADYNYVFVKTPQVTHLDSVVVGPPKQNTLVYVLSKNQQIQREVLHVPQEINEPQVYFVEYENEHENIELPGDVDLKTALDQQSTPQVYLRQSSIQSGKYNTYKNEAETSVHDQSRTGKSLSSSDNANSLNLSEKDGENKKEQEVENELDNESKIEHESEPADGSEILADSKTAATSETDIESPVESGSQVENESEVEIESPVETKSAVETESEVEIESPVESKSAVETESEVEIESPVETKSAVETETVPEELSTVEINSPVEIKSAVDSESLGENESTVQSESQAENESPVEIQFPVENRSNDETTLNVDNESPVETGSIIDSEAAVEIESAVQSESPVESESPAIEEEIFVQKESSSGSELPAEKHSQDGNVFTVADESTSVVSKAEGTSSLSSNFGLASTISVGLDEAPSAAIGGARALGLSESDFGSSDNTPSQSISSQLANIGKNLENDAHPVDDATNQIEHESQSISSQLDNIGKNLQTAAHSTDDATSQIAHESPNTPINVGESHFGSIGKNLQKDAQPLDDVINQITRESPSTPIDIGESHFGSIGKNLQKDAQPIDDTTNQIEDVIGKPINFGKSRLGAIVLNPKATDSAAPSDANSIATKVRVESSNSVFVGTNKEDTVTEKTVQLIDITNENFSSIDNLLASLKSETKMEIGKPAVKPLSAQLKRAGVLGGEKPVSAVSLKENVRKARNPNRLLKNLRSRFTRFGY